MRFEQAVEVFRAFEREEVRYVLIGSMAMAAQGIVRATRAVDFFVEADRDNVDRIKRALTVEGIAVPVATPRMLYEMKRDTVRPQDRVDAANLRDTFDLKD